jgi:hypothetical protein
VSEDVDLAEIQSFAQTLRDVEDLDDSKRIPQSRKVWVENPAFRMIISWTEQYKRFVPQAQFIMFEKSGHFPFIEETDRAMYILRDFLKPKVK